MRSWINERESAKYDNGEQTNPVCGVRIYRTLFISVSIPIGCMGLSFVGLFYWRFAVSQFVDALAEMAYQPSLSTRSSGGKTGREISKAQGI